MSKVIKKVRISPPVTLPAAPSSFSSDRSTESSTRSLDFSRTVRGEIARWRERFDGFVEGDGTIRDRRLERADREGYDRGFRDGVAKEREDRIVMIDVLLREARRRREEAIRDIETKVVELAVRIAERIIERSIEARPETVLGIVREVMEHIAGGETVVLKVSEEDHPLVNERYEEWLGMSGNAREFRIEADRRLRRGDCLIETEGGIIDAVLSNRLDYLVEELLKHS